MSRFEINNDLLNPIWNFHNKCHFFITLIIASCAPLYSFLGMSGVLVALSGFIVAYGSFFAWEIGDGFKPWYYKFVPRHGGNWQDWLRQELLYSDKFSLQDILIWNLLGSVSGSLLAGWYVS